ncbi:MAG: Allantoinase, partial [uncultured Gemmatimonadetes bacterium]
AASRRPGHPFAPRGPARRHAPRSRPHLRRPHCVRRRLRRCAGWDGGGRGGLHRHARAGGHARARQRAGAHRVGGMGDGDARRGGGRSDLTGRNAPEQHPGDHQRPRADAEGGRGVEQVQRGRGVLGRRGARQRGGPPRVVGGGRLRLQVLSRPVRRRRVPARGRGGPAARHARAGGTGRPAAGARGASGAAGARRGFRRRNGPAQLRGLRPLAPAGSGGAGDRAGHPPVPRVRHARTRGAPGGGRGAPPAARRPRPGAAGDGGNLPALPALRGRRHRGRRDGVQVRAAHPGQPEPAGAVGCARGRRHRPGGLRPLPLPAGDEGARGGRLVRGLGRHRLAAAGASRDVERGQGARDGAGAHRALDERGAGAPGGTGGQERRHRPRPGCRPGGVGPRRTGAGGAGDASSPPQADAVRGRPLFRRGAGDVRSWSPGVPPRPVHRRTRRAPSPSRRRM